MRSLLLVLLAAIALPISFAQAQFNVILSEAGVNADVGGTSGITTLSGRPVISANGRYIGIEANLSSNAAVVVDLQTSTKTLLVQEGVTVVPDSGGVLFDGTGDTVEVNDSGQAFFFADTEFPSNEDFGAFFWDGITLTNSLFEGDPTPAGTPDTEYGISFLDPQLTNGGVIGGDFDTSTSVTQDDFLQLGSSVLLASGVAPPVGFTPTDQGAVNSAFTDFEVSADGNHFIVEVDTSDNSSTDLCLVVNGAVVAQEGVTTHTLPGGTIVTFDNTFDTDIAEGGTWIAEVVSESAALPPLDYALVNGTAVEAEAGTAPDGSTFQTLLGVTINANGDYVTIWDTLGTNGEDDLLLFNSDTILISENEVISVDYDGDGTFEDLVVDEFSTEALDLADDGTLAIVVNFSDTEGNEVGDALMTFSVGGSVLLGDVNLDGAVNFLDITPFIGVLSTGGFQAEADIDESGAVNFLDITPFIGILSS